MRLLLCLSMLLVMSYCVDFTSAQLDPSEITALTALRASWASVVTVSPTYPEWGSNIAAACDDGTGLSWDGIWCTGGHVTRLNLDSRRLNSFIPEEIVGLVHLTHLILPNNGLTGTLPTNLTAMSNLIFMRLDGNALNLCAHETILPGSLAMNDCDARNQDLLRCGFQCCGCAANWTSQCLVNVESCDSGVCSEVAPTTGADTICYRNNWYIQSSYKGGLEVRGAVTVLGDLTVVSGQPFLFFGLGATLNVTGAIDIRERPIFVVSDAEVKQLKDLGKYSYYRAVFLWYGKGEPIFSTFGYAHTRRHCQKPSVSIYRGDYTTRTDPYYDSSSSSTASVASVEATSASTLSYYSYSMRNTNACNTWWIILLCVLPALLVGIIGGTLPLIISKCC